ncbi:MAG: zinc-binding dehydrogenase [Pseudomonadota bacterium]
MNDSLPARMRQIRSTVTSDGELRLTLAEVDVPQPADDEVLVRVEATPINPSDLGLLFGGADMTSATASGSADAPVVTAPVPDAMLEAMKGRLDQSLPVGNEGAGVVVAAGDSDAARALLGRTVAVFGGAMYAEYRAVKAAQCLVLEEGTSPREGASCFVNPLTALSMVETMRLEGHRGLVHTAAASNLGQMLNRICLKDGVPLVNVVRRPQQKTLLENAGARYVVDSSSDDFAAALTDALEATGATLAFDAIGGGDLAGRILACMEAAVLRSAESYSRYGSDVHKQVYIYGGLDRGPTIVHRTFGMAWGMGGWLLPPFLERIGPEAADRLRRRVAAEIRTTFASHYTREVSLTQALSLDAIAEYGRQATGEKYLIVPGK